MVPELLTARAAGGVAVLAFRGAERRRQAAELFGLAEVGDWQGPRLVDLRLGGEDFDQALWLDRPDLGQLELHLHGAPALLERLEQVVGPLGTLAAGRGEDLLRRAAGRAQLELALEQAGLDFEGHLAWVETLAPEQRGPELQALQERSRVAQALAQPQRLVLCGPQNAGKSTLMNRLLFEQRVLTGAEPGLTRDPVRALVLLAGFPYELVDTAGLGEVRGSLDAQAQERGRQLWSGALLILVADGAAPAPEGLDELRRQAVLLLRSKADLEPAAWPESWQPQLELSCLHATASQGLRQQLGEALRQRRGLPPAGPVGGIAALDAAELAVLDGLVARCFEVGS